MSTDDMLVPATPHCAELGRNYLVLRAGTTFEEWLDLGDRLGTVSEGVMWWVGDWWRSGQRYGERAKAVAESGRWSFGTYMNAGYVCGAFETSRRHEVLPFSYHQEVASLSPGVADELLDLAEEHHWTQAVLRAEVKRRKRMAKTERLLTTPLAETLDEPIRVTDCLTLIDSLADASVGLLLTDPPYAVTDNAWDVWESEDDYWEFMADWLEALRPKMAEESTAFIFCDADASPRLNRTLIDTGWPVLRQVIWHRPNLAKKRAGSLTFLSAYEPFWHCGNRGLNLPDEWGGERFDVQSVTVPQSNHVADPAYHPTQKPIELMQRLVQVGSFPGELVIDPFSGSGTTPLAAHIEGRPYLAGDLDERYVQIARSRIAQQTAAP